MPGRRAAPATPPKSLRLAFPGREFGDGGKPRPEGRAGAHGDPRRASGGVGDQKHGRDPVTHRVVETVVHPHHVERRREDVGGQRVFVPYRHRRRAADGLPAARIEHVAQGPSFGHPRPFAGAAGGERAGGQREDHRRPMAAGGMGEGHRPAGVGPRAAHRYLAPEVDHPRQARGRGGGQPPQGLALAEGTGVEGGVGRARDAAGLRLEPEVREAGRRPRRAQGVRRGDGAARAQPPDLDEPPDRGVERAPREAVPAREPRPQAAQRRGQGERLVHGLAVEGAQDAVGPPRAERLLDALHLADHPFEQLPPGRPVGRLHDQGRPGPHQMDGAFDRNPFRGRLPAAAVRTAGGPEHGAPGNAAARRGAAGNGSDSAGGPEPGAPGGVTARGGDAGRGSDRAATAAGECGTGAPGPADDGGSRQDVSRAVGDDRGGPRDRQTGDHDERRGSHGEGRTAGRSAAASRADPRPSRQPMTTCVV